MADWSKMCTWVHSTDWYKHISGRNNLNKHICCDFPNLWDFNWERVECILSESSCILGVLMWETGVLIYLKIMF